MNLLDTELTARALEKIEAGFVVLLLQDMMDLMLKYLNGYVTLNDPGHSKIQKSDMVQ